MMDRLKEIDHQIKQNTKVIDMTVLLVNKSIDKEFDLARRNKELREEKKAIIHKRFEI